MTNTLRVCVFRACVCPCLGVFTRGKAETRWDCSRPTLCSGSVLVSACGRSLQVSMATETKAR